MPFTKICIQETKEKSLNGDLASRKSLTEIKIVQITKENRDNSDISEIVTLTITEKEDSEEQYNLVTVNNNNNNSDSNIIAGHTEDGKILIDLEIAGTQLTEEQQDSLFRTDASRPTGQVNTEEDVSSVTNVEPTKSGLLLEENIGKEQDSARTTSKSHSDETIGEDILTNIDTSEKGSQIVETNLEEPVILSKRHNVDEDIAEDRSIVATADIAKTESPIVEEDNEDEHGIVNKTDIVKEGLGIDERNSYGKNSLNSLDVTKITPQTVENEVAGTNIKTNKDQMKSTYEKSVRRRSKVFLRKKSFSCNFNISQLQQLNREERLIQIQTKSILEKTVEMSTVQDTSEEDGQCEDSNGPLGKRKASYCEKNVKLNKGKKTKMELLLSVISSMHSQRRENNSEDALFGHYVSQELQHLYNIPAKQKVKAKIISTIFAAQSVDEIASADVNETLVDTKANTRDEGSFIVKKCETMTLSQMTALDKDD